MKSISLLILTFVFITCQNKNPTSSQFKNTNYEVVSSLDSLTLVYGEKSYTNKKYKTLVYFNGNCSYCITEVVALSNKIASLKLKKYSNIEFITYSDELNILEYYFNLWQWEYSVYFDLDSLFIKNNNINTNHIVFITDAENTILYKGDFISDTNKIYSLIDTTLSN